MYYEIEKGSLIYKDSIPSNRLSTFVNFVFKNDYRGNLILKADAKIMEKNLNDIQDESWYAIMTIIEHNNKKIEIIEETQEISRK